MNHAKPLVGLILVGLMAVGCSMGTRTAEDYQEALADAKVAVQKASKVNYEWRDTGKILKKAEAAAKAGDFDKAVELANRAERQGELAFAQYHQQRNAGPH